MTNETVFDRDFRAIAVAFYENAPSMLVSNGEILDVAESIAKEMEKRRNARHKAVTANAVNSFNQAINPWRGGTP